MDKNKPKIVTHIDLFAGAGGIATGFRAAGIKTLMAIEYVNSCCETYSTNHPETKMICSDIREITNKQIKKELNKLNYNGIDIVSAGFPCETFSTAGSKSRVYNDHRNYLYKEAIRIADTVKAKLLVMENVPAFLSKKIEKGSNIKIYDLLVEDLEKAGYKYHKYEILHAVDYGVPQNRSRFILVASKTIKINNFSLKKEKNIVTVKEAFSDLPKIKDNQSSEFYSSEPQNNFQKKLRLPSFWGITDNKRINLSYHITPKHRPGTIKRFQLIKQGKGLRDIFTELTKKEITELQKQKILPNKWFIQRNFRLISNQPSKTVTSHCLDELIHPNLDRGLSVREVARLQSFPDWYDFKGGPILCPHIYKTQDKYEQIGDAVPPLLARSLGLYLIGLLH
jgi:DNA (cytosine-5)-methyltransferase 1